MSDLNALVERAEAALEGVTVGPWRTDEDGCCVDPVAGDIAGPIAQVAVGFGEGSPNDARFIAASRSFVPEMVAALRAVIPVVEAAVAYAEKRRWATDKGWPFSSDAVAIFDAVGALSGGDADG